MTFSVREMSLGQVCEIKQGKYLAPNQMEPTPTNECIVPVIGGNGVLGYTDQSTFPFPVPLVTCRGSKCGLMQWAEPPTWISNNAMAVFFKENQGDNFFLHQYLLNSSFDDVTTGSAQPQITVTNLSLKKILLPDLQTQRTISSIMKNIEAKIATNNVLSKTLEDIAQTIFKSWFIDFDPVKAKMAGENPEGMDAATAALFSDSMEESELGFIPKGWEIRKIESLCETLLGGTPSRTRDEFWGGEIPWINSGKVNDFRVTAASEYITELGLEKSATKLLPKGTTVLAITGATLGQFSRLEIDSCANQSVVGIVGSAEASNEFIYLNIKNGIQRLISAQTGGAQQHINKEDVNAFFIVYPGKKLMDAFTDVVEGTFDEIGVLLNQSISLAEIRDSLLSRLISGELEIPEGMLAS
jgi:type I restriction enzyme S subunit